ncbi:uncharacterized protein STEHIDRAFT_46238 [Stereum hirsutum FP-91666 SS1]|uniref:uncharacterized protein n=1 Tax=Stereum hirsutum (strain FP-91666) TaxID=721885 RepID=UPI000440BD8D|nr:uncharacterized protein STEHIDRAFT_46238 [Stereum hirsutum FP-91666 SS1]EIM91961.1 hypothetical protein STEHIDRAFT_46238 [Stereum hirsutum FP-91666 SS1]
MADYDVLSVYSLSSPFMDPSPACGFFDIILGLFLEAKVNTGKLIGTVYHVHCHYLSDTSASARFTDSLLTTIRQQRHLNTRVLISTQEPTVVPSKFLELSSFIITHRFSSPKWLRHLSAHVSAPQERQDELFSKVGLFCITTTHGFIKARCSFLSFVAVFRS